MTSSNPYRKLLVGLWDTPESDLATVGAAATHRQATASAWHDFSERLTGELSRSISPNLQKGKTADSIRDAFTQGAGQARDVSEINETISRAHTSAHHSASDLNSQLDTIADNGKSRIDTIQNSKESPVIKFGQIVEVVMDCQQQANTAAAPHTQNVFEAMQTILDRRGIPMSARQFAQQHGLDTTRMLGSPSKQSVTEQVKQFLDRPNSPQTPPPSDAPTAPGDLLQGTPPPPPPSQTTQAPGELSQGAAPPPLQAGNQVARAPGGLMQGAEPGTAATPAIRSPVATGGLPAAGTPLAPGGLSSIGSSSPIGQAGLTGLQPTNALSQGLNPALGQGTPMSGAFNNVPPVTSPVQPQLPVQPTTSEFSGSTVPATSHAPAFDAPPPAPPAPVAPHTAVTDSAPAYLAGPAAAAPATPAGPLPTYGSDIRPPTPTISAPTIPSSPSAISSVSSAASPASAPVSPSAGAGGLAQPVVRTPPTAAMAHPAPAGIGEQAVAAAAGGAAAGAASAAATAKARLQRLVDFVASQEPRLRWAAGEKPDGTTILATDLASGWIPPNIAIPSVVTLLEPGERRGDLEMLLGEVSVSASYAPLHYLPESPVDGEPIPTSPRPRQVPAVDELGWELGQATNWRDGLPQMAHTLAKAASAGTGVVDNEVEFLHQHLAMLRDRVLDAYPDDVDGAAVANWQLLASIEALAASDTNGANYHFAWFQALNRVS